MSATLAIDIVTDAAGLAELVPDWDELWNRVPDASPFQSSPWVLAWWRQFGTSRPAVATLRDERRILGLLPCYVLAESTGRKLLPMGVGLSDYVDALVASEAPFDAAAHLLAAILAAAPDVGICDLPDLPPGASLLTAPAPPNWRSATSPGEPCPVLDLPPGVPDLEAIVPAKTRRKLRMNRHRAERIGGWTTRLASADTLEADLDRLIRFHQARWQAQGQPGVFADPRVARFHRDAAPRLLQAGVLRLVSLEIGAAVAAACLALLAPPDRLLLYLSGFDAAFASVSPGTILLGEIVEGAMRDGCAEIHFLRGGESYKYAWGGVDRRNTARHLVRRS